MISKSNMTVSGKNTAKTVGKAFKIFRENSVDLGFVETERARGSRDFLSRQLHELCGRNADLAKVKTCNLFGSFARRTKIRPLDDIDLLIVFEREGVSFSPGGYILKQSAPCLSVKDKSSLLKSFEDESEYLNSVKVLNRLVASLRDVSICQKADIKRDQEAAVLNLPSYSWKLNVVPVF